jgi:hypothetical protein
MGAVRLVVEESVKGAERSGQDSLIPAFVGAICSEGGVASLAA